MTCWSSLRSTQQGGSKLSTNFGQVTRPLLQKGWQGVEMSQASLVGHL